MSQENAILVYEQKEALLESFDLDELENKLQSQLDENLDDLDFLVEEGNKLGTPEHMGDVLERIVWDQVRIHFAGATGIEFIEENGGQTLDLRTSAHVQSVDNFEQQKYATHNKYVDYEKRGKAYRDQFYTDPNVKPNFKQNQDGRYNQKTGAWEFYDTVDGEWKKSLKPDYRKPYEEDRAKDKKNKFGSKTTHKDHQVADATIARNAEAGTYMSTEEKAKMANSEKNLRDLDAAANQSKSDHDGEKWIKHQRTGKKGQGQTNGEYFGIDEEKYIEDDKKAKEFIEEEIRKKREEEIALGKKSQKEEGLRAGKAAIKTLVKRMLMDLLKSIVNTFVQWLKSAQRKSKQLIEDLKVTIRKFVDEIGTKLIHGTVDILTTIAQAIWGPIVEAVMSIFNILKAGWSVLKNAIAEIRKPENKGKSKSILMMRIGEVLIASLTGVGSVALGSSITAVLMGIPGLNVPIPIIGTLASVFGMFFGAVISGIIGALGINQIEKLVTNQLKKQNRTAQIDKANDVLVLQREVKEVAVANMEYKKGQAAFNIQNRHVAADLAIHDAMERIKENIADDGSIDNKLANLKALLSK